MDGVDEKFEACVVVVVFPPGICLVPPELKCYNINHQEPTGEARIDERTSLVVSFVVPHAATIPLRFIVDTGSGLSILTFSAFNRVAVQTGAMLKPYPIDLYAANGKTIKTFGMAEHERFQLGGYELETSFVVADDAMGADGRPQLPPSLPSARRLDLDEDSSSCTPTTHVALCSYSGR